MQWLKRLWREVTPIEMATRELVMAERSKLEAETGREFADSSVAYNAARIKRLTKYIREQANAE